MRPHVFTPAALVLLDLPVRRVPEEGADAVEVLRVVGAVPAIAAVDETVVAAVQGRGGRRVPHSSSSRASSGVTGASGDQAR